MKVTSRLHGKNNCDCTCSNVCGFINSCDASFALYPSLTTLWQMIVCPKEDEDEWHAKKCFYGQCKHCGIKKNPFCPIECDDFNYAMVDWKRFAMETTMLKARKPLKKLTLVYKKTNSEEFIEYFKTKLQKHFRHNFVSRWQDKQFKAFVLSFPRNIVVSIVDFTKNYSFKLQNEV